MSQLHAPFPKSVACGAMHYRNPTFCQVSSGLLSVFFGVLGKEALCRVPKKYLKKTLDKEGSLPRKNTRQVFAECFFDTRQRARFGECFFGTRQ